MKSKDQFAGDDIVLITFLLTRCNAPRIDGVVWNPSASHDKSISTLPNEKLVKLLKGRESVLDEVYDHKRMLR